MYTNQEQQSLNQCNFILSKYRFLLAMIIEGVPESMSTKSLESRV